MKQRAVNFIPETIRNHMPNKYVYVFSYNDLVTAMSMMPEGYGPKEMMNWHTASLQDKLAGEVKELIAVFKQEHGDTADLKTNIIRECADIFNVLFALCARYNTRWPQTVTISSLYSPRREKNLWNACCKITNVNVLESVIDEQKTINFLTEVLNYVKLERWELNLRDIVIMMPIKAMEKGYKSPEVQSL